MKLLDRLSEGVLFLALCLSNAIMVPENTRVFFFLGFAVLLWLNIALLVGGTSLWLLYWIFS